MLSNITPRFLTVEEGTGHPSKLLSKRFCVLFFRPISIISVLSEFNRRNYWSSFTFLTHSVSLDNLEVSSGLVRNIFEYHQHKKWKLIPYFLIILPRGNMYIEYNRGPRTDPCGTPYFTDDN